MISMSNMSEETEHSDDDAMEYAHLLYTQLP